MRDTLGVLALAGWVRAKTALPPSTRRFDAKRTGRPLRRASTASSTSTLPNCYSKTTDLPPRLNPSPSTKALSLTNRHIREKRRGGGPHVRRERTSGEFTKSFPHMQGRSTKSWSRGTAAGRLTRKHFYSIGLRRATPYLLILYRRPPSTK